MHATDSHRAPLTGHTRPCSRHTSAKSYVRGGGGESRGARSLTPATCRPSTSTSTVLRSVSGSAQRTQLSTCRRPGASITRPSARPAWYADRCPGDVSRVDVARLTCAPRAARAARAAGAATPPRELGTGGAPTRLAPVPHDLPGGGVPPPGRRAQRPEVDLSVCDLQDLAIHAPALDPSEHEIAHGNPLELHRSHSARSRSASFCVAPEGSVERRRAPHQLHVWSGGEGGLGGWPFSRPREAACRHRLEQ
jgi:hypothetical protein